MDNKNNKCKFTFKYNAPTCNNVYILCNCMLIVNVANVRQSEN